MQGVWPQFTQASRFNLFFKDVFFLFQYYIDGLVQDCSNSIANIPELLQSFTETSIYNTQIKIIYIARLSKKCIYLMVFNLEMDW